MKQLDQGYSLAKTCLIIAVIIIVLAGISIYFRGVMGEIERTQIQDNKNLEQKYLKLNEDTNNKIDFIEQTVEQKYLNINENIKVQNSKLNDIEVLRQKDFNVLNMEIKNGNYVLSNQISSLNSQIKDREYQIYDTYLKKPSIDYLDSTVVYIKGSRTDGDNWTGTGFVIKIDSDYTYVLTNSHVAGNYKTEDLIIKVEDLEVCDIQYSDKVDLALLKVKAFIPHKQPVKGFSPAIKGEKAFLYGHHLGLPYVYGEGVVSDELVDIPELDTPFTCVQISAIYGNSGSPIFNKDGNVIAVVFAVPKLNMFAVDSGMAVCVTYDQIQEFLQDKI